MTYTTHDLTLGPQWCEVLHPGNTRTLVMLADRAIRVPSSQVFEQRHRAFIDVSRRRALRKWQKVLSAQRRRAAA